MTVECSDTREQLAATPDPLPPLTPPRPNAGQGIDWDRPVGYSHAAAILAILPDVKES